MRIVIIGGSGHVGTYLVPRLVAAEHEVINISRAQSEPYQSHSAWRLVQQVTADRTAEDAAELFGRRILELKPDVVIDLICFTLESAQQLVGCLRERVQHFLHCGTIWVLGHSVEVPATEETPRHPFGDYGIQKAAIQDYLLDQARRYGFPATVIQPGHIVGPGWIPINPAGNLDPNIFTRLARGEEVTLPNIGMETLHHVHADDVAQSFLHGDCKSKCEHWRSISRCFAGRAYPARIRRKGCWLVRSARKLEIPAVGRMAQGRRGRVRRTNMGSHGPQSQREHCQGAAPVGLSPAL